jgi:ABC-2 type transport system ATP-binding protein
MEQVEEICDHIILMNRGKKILDGTVKNIKQQFKENLFAIILDHIPDEPPPDSFEIISSADQKLIVKISEGYRPNDVLRYYLQKDIPITGFYELLPSMNDIFIRLVEGTSYTRQFQKITA